MSASGASAEHALPRLAFAYHPRSFGTMAIAEAAHGVCELVWIVDTSDPEVGSMSRLLRRVGSIVDVAGMQVEQAAAAIAATRPDGILALADSLLLWTAEVAALLDLPFMTPEVAARLTDKYLQREALRRGGLPVPGFWPVPGAADEPGWRALEQSARFPAVLKPRRGEASRDIVRVGSFEQLRALVAETPAPAESDEPELVLEEYLGDRPEAAGHHFADYVSVESIVSNGRISHLAITGRFPPADPFRETGFFIPSAFDTELSGEIAAVATAAIEAIGIGVGALHTEIKLTPEGPRVIELNGRIGGGVPEMLADAETGIELLAIALRIALGESIAFDELPRCAKVAYLLYVQAPASMTTVRGVDGLERLRAQPGVAEVTLNRGPGRSVDWRAGNHGHVFSVRGAVGDHEQLRSLERFVSTEVEIRGD
jgi:biotin carboxylase